MYADYYSMTLNKYKIFDRAVSTEYFRNIKDGSVIYAPDFVGVHYIMDWLNYVTITYSPDKTFIFTNNINDLKYDRPTYILKYNEINKSIFLAPIDSNMHTNESVIISLTPLKSKTLIINKEKEGIINNKDYAAYYDKTAIIPFNNIVNEKEDNILIYGEKLDVNKFNLVSETLYNNKNTIISIMKKYYNPSNGFGEMLISGWSNIESWGCWSEGNTAQLGFSLQDKKEVLINLNLRVFSSPTYFSIDVNGVRIDEYTVEDENKMSILIKTDYLVEKNGLYPVVVQFNIKNPAMMEGNSRLLGIGLTSFYLNQVE
jgi:hypothetical protein